MNGRFLNIINSRKPVLVDFYADWCGPCKQMPPILKEIKSEFKENVRIIKVNVDKNPIIASRYHIRNIPTLIIFKNGEPCWTGVGLHPANELTSILKSHIEDQ
ncbi:MAG: thioredoxin [Draconibacterium sp.]|jgi:thioredoxin 1